MPEFFANEIKTAKVTITNTAAKAFDFKGRLYIDVAAVTEAMANFRLNAGESKQVPFNIAMPAAAGVYPVYLSVHTDNTLVGLYKSTEDLTITSDTILAVKFTGQTTVNAQIYNASADKWLSRGEPSMLYPDIPDTEIKFRFVGEKVMIFVARGTWPVIDWWWFGPYLATVRPGRIAFDAASGKLNGLELEEISAVPNRAKITGAMGGFAWWGPTFPRVWSAVVQVQSYEDVPGYRSIGVFLPRTVAFWADLSRWPMNVNGEPIFTPGQPVQAEINYAYHIVENRQRYAELWGKIWPL